VKAFTVFYAGLLVGSFDRAEEKQFTATCGPEMYVGAYMYRDTAAMARSSAYEFTGWFRLDGTPVLLQGVPKALRLQILLLT